MAVGRYCFRIPLVVVLVVACLPLPAFSQDAGSKDSSSEAKPDEQGDRKEVPRGINDNFLAPDLNAEEWQKRFEVESREVYAGRADVVKALHLSPGMRIADVGSGTGLYLSSFSAAVGSEGRVFAVDISPRLIEHIQKRVATEKMENVAVVRSNEKSITLPEDSTDRIFICDTYHHFEFYVDMLASIRQSLSPDGELVIIDFERIPGTSREWTLSHVRAGKEQVRREVEEAGFTFVEEVKIPEFKENYLLRFRR
ncbi:MAG: class I SAM-dependent methyltransferase [Planctomycetaceae bacterium]|nr:class I SAM-dependent methyltransferase [Planctomycetaceae bacterium]